MSTHRIDSGKIFDYSVTYEHSMSESMKLVSSYFTNSEIKNKIILDAGCRLGYNSYAFVLKRCRTVKGVDLSEKCIQAAKKKFRKHKNMEFSIGDIKNLHQFKDSQFDIVFCFGTIIYLNRERMKQALEEFVRVTKPGGTILVSFQKEKFFFVRLLTYITNIINIRIFLKLINLLSLLIHPLAKFIIGRKVSLDYLKYDVLLSLRGIHYGVPVNILQKYRIKTTETESSSGRTTIIYKITVPRNKNLFFPPSSN